MITYLIIMDFGRPSLASGAIGSYESKERAEEVCAGMNEREQGIYSYSVLEVTHFPA